MTSPATTTTRYRCTACGREFVASSAYVRHGLSHLVDPAGRSPRVCFRGRWEPVAAVAELPIARDDRAGITISTAVQPVGGDQLVASGAGGGDEGGDRGHEDSIATIAGDVTAHASDDGAQAFAREAACPR